VKTSCSERAFLLPSTSPGRTMSKQPRRIGPRRIGASPDTDTLYPKHIDSGAARVVTLCFGFCSAVRCVASGCPPWATLSRARLAASRVRQLLERC
jgi:hypothetical protein